jgi:hypothetical protein
VKHFREGSTPQSDGTLLADCACGTVYIVPQSNDEFGALEAAQAAHERGAIIPPTAGILSVFTTGELEALIITAADLWANAPADSRGELSSRQIELAKRAAEWAEAR